MPVYDLKPEHDKAASFYGKAQVRDNKGDLELISYDTRVVILYADGHARVHGMYSQTTTRHIKEFLKQNGVKAENTKQILADYGVEHQQKTHQADFAT